MSVTEALRRLDDMLPRVEQDIRRAIRIEATMEGGNDVVHAFKDSGEPVSFTSAPCFDIIQGSLVWDLALTLTRLVDTGKRCWWPRCRRDVASIPALLWLLRPGGCHDLVARRAAGWMSPSTMVAAAAVINDARATYARFSRSAEGRAALRSLRRFRNRLLAHHLMVPLDKLPTYGELFTITKCLGPVLAALLLAVEGQNFDPAETASRYRADAVTFWTTSLRGLGFVRSSAP